MTPTEMQDICNQITFPKMLIQVRTRGDVSYLQVHCRGECNVTGEKMDWRGRKWMLSEQMTDGEIVQTAFKAILTALEHEAREQFRYMGQAVFDPHYDIAKLVALRATADSIKERTAPDLRQAESALLNTDRTMTAQQQSKDGGPS